MTHTPGPWTCRTKDGCISRYVEGNGITVAEVWSDGTSDDGAEFAANARLIAAAPDLLAALQPLLDYAVDPAQWSKSDLSRFIDAGSEAIRAATGVAG